MSVGVFGTSENPQRRHPESLWLFDVSSISHQTESDGRVHRPLHKTVILSVAPSRSVA
jgi:hypothetical protein